MQLLNRSLAAVSIATLMAMGTLQPVVADEVGDQVKNAYSAWDAAFNKKDANAIAAFYTDDAYFLPPTHKVIEGPKGVAEFFSGLFKGGVTNHKLEMIEANGNGNIVIAAAKWSAKGKDKKGKVTDFHGLSIHVFEKQTDGILKLKLHTFN